MVTHSGILARKIPWAEEPAYSPWGRRIRHDWAYTDTHFIKTTKKIKACLDSGMRQT